MPTDRTRQAKEKWNKENLKRISIALLVSADADIIQMLDALPNGTKNQFIKNAIREYMKKLSL